MSTYVQTRECLSRDLLQEGTGWEGRGDRVGIRRPFGRARSKICSLPAAFRLLVPSYGESPVRNYVGELCQKSFVRLLYGSHLFRTVLYYGFFGFEGEVRGYLVKCAVYGSRVAKTYRKTSQCRGSIVFLANFARNFFIFGQEFCGRVRNAL